MRRSNGPDSPSCASTRAGGPLAAFALFAAALMSPPAVSQGADGDAGMPAARLPVAATTAPPASGAAGPVQPQHPVAAKAYIVFETYCARCHQAGRTGAVVKPSRLADILHLDDVARVPSLVRPGNPDGSRLYQRMFQHPHATSSPDDRSVEPTASEIEAVRDWIEDLPKRADPRVEACTARGRSTDAETAARWLEQAGADKARDTRFVSLSHLADACASDRELAVYRQAVSQILNGLSWSSRPAAVETVGDASTLLAVRLSDLGWLPAHWDKLVAAYPRAAIAKVNDTTARVTGTDVPVLPGDWLASVATRSPLYEELLGLPPTLVGLARLLSADLAPRVGEGRGGGIARLGVVASAETHVPRLIERQVVKGRPFWLAYDLGPRGEKYEPLDHPLLPTRQVAAGKGTPQVDGTRALFALPNGLPAFAAFDGSGSGSRAPADPAREGATSTCIACHAVGTIKAADEMRLHLDGDRFAGDSATREAARRLYPGVAEIQRLFDQDAQAFRLAIRQAGSDPDATLYGHAPAAALARQYELDVDLGRAAAEFGLDRQAFADRLKSFDGPEAVQVLALRLVQGPLPRADADRLLVAMRNGPKASSGSVPQVTVAPRAGAAPTVALWTDTAVYRKGELLAVNVETGADCHLTVLSVDPAGKATVLFPNDFDQDNLIRGGRVHRIPAKNGAYNLRLKDKGTETLIAHCDTRAKSPDGIEHDFERQRFTVLGNWRNFLRGVAEDGPNVRRDADRGGRGRGRRVARNRNGENGNETRSDALRPDPDPRSETFSRTAIQVTVD